MNYRPLGTSGLNISALSLGGAAIGQQYGPVTVAEVDATVRFAIEGGINFIDTAAYYGEGRSEEILGEVLNNGLREKVLLGTKAGRLGINRFDFTPAGFRKCFEESLKRLRTDRVEVLLAHDIEFADDYDRVFDETARTLEALKAEGKTRLIGMSALPLSILKDAITKCRLDVVISYCHYHLQDQTLITNLLPIAESKGVGVFNASPLAMGLFTTGGPPPWHPGDAEIKAVCTQAVKYCRERGADISALGMQYCMAEPRIASVITGTAKKAELEANLKAIQSPLDREILKEVQVILAPVMNRTWPSGRMK